MPWNSFSAYFQPPVNVLSLQEPPLQDSWFHLSTTSHPEEKELVLVKLSSESSGNRKIIFAAIFPGVV